MLAVQYVVWNSVDIFLAFFPFWKKKIVCDITVLSRVRVCVSAFRLLNNFLRNLAWTFCHYSITLLHSRPCGVLIKSLIQYVCQYAHNTPCTCWIIFMKICIGGNYEKLSRGFISLALGKIRGDWKVTWRPIFNMVQPVSSDSRATLYNVYIWCPMRLSPPIIPCGKRNILITVRLLSHSTLLMHCSNKVRIWSASLLCSN